jgi:hypothetical protein
MNPSSVIGHTMLLTVSLGATFALTACASATSDDSRNATPVMSMTVRQPTTIPSNLTIPVPPNLKLTASGCGSTHIPTLILV